MRRALQERPHVLVTQPLHADVLERLESFATVEMNPGPEPWSQEEIAQRLANADGWVAFMTDRVDAALLSRAPRLRHIACALKGDDNFDRGACEAAGVGMSIVRDLLTEPTAELAVGLAIAAARNVLAGDALVRGGHFAGWRPTLYGTGLHGSVAAIVGLGAVGRAIVDRLQGFDCSKLLGVDASVVDERVLHVSFAEAIELADYLFLALPLNAETHHLLNRDALNRCRRGQIVVNVGRGSVVDESAVAAALADGRIGAYAADVFEMEDWRLEARPREIDLTLLNSSQTVFTPHLGSAVARVRRAIESEAVDALLEALQRTEESMRPVTL
jgi:phosphonate dehydrogenase